MSCRRKKNEKESSSKPILKTKKKWKKEERSGIHDAPARCFARSATATTVGEGGNAPNNCGEGGHAPKVFWQTNNLKIMEGELGKRS